MKNIKVIEKLNEISQLKERGDIQAYFDDLADYLFHHVAIEAGDDTFTFIEVEFYYYQKGEVGKKGIFDGEKIFNCTYPRTQEAGKLLWHYSGVDICFKSIEKDKFFGGILIRSLMKKGKKNKKDEIIAGPMRCSNELMNSCNEKMPSLIDYEANLDKEPVSTIRYGIKADLEQKESPIYLAYYIKPDSWNRNRGKVLVANKAGGYDKRDKIDSYPANPERRENN